MFKNSGKQIKSIAIWNMLCFSLISLLGAFAFWNSEQILLGFIVLFLGISIAWSSVILLYGYGDLIDETIKNRQESEKTNQLLEMLINNCLPQNEKTHSPDDPASTTSSQKHTAYFSEKKPAVDSTPSGWLCPKCGSRNSELTMACKTCCSAKETKAQHDNGVVRKTTQNKPTTESTTVPISQNSVSAGGWTCKECGKHNTSTTISCKSCGAAR